MCLLSASRIADDPRVRRHGDALAAAGWEVSAVGFGEARSPAPDWRIVGLPFPGEPRVPRRLARLAALVVGGRMPMTAPLMHATVMHPAFYGVAASEVADLYIANDWPMLPLAVKLARQHGGLCLYDSHELALAEYSEIRKWRVFNLPYVRAIEERFIGEAAAVVTVSDGIADRMRDEYGLAARPTVIRNMPRLREVARDDRQRSDGVHVLYHGVLAPGRGLEQLILSVVQWRPEFSLTIRGPANAPYLDQLRGLTVTHNVAGRIEFAEPVSPERLIAEAANSDIGMVAMPADTLNATFALPNKFFEYIMAGLALCVTDLPEMTALLRRYDLGRSAAGFDATAIATAINGFTPELLERYRGNARVAAGELNWQRESARLIDLCNRTIGVAA